MNETEEMGDNVHKNNTAGKRSEFLENVQLLVNRTTYYTRNCY
jgi:hypothetical protein